MKKTLLLFCFLTACSQGGGLNDRKEENIKKVDSDVVSSVLTIKEDEKFVGSFRKFIIANNETYEITQFPAQGSLIQISADSFSFEPPKDFNGSLSFSFKTSKGEEKTVAVEVLPVNDAPVLSNSTFSLVEKQSGSFNLSVIDPDSSFFNCQILNLPSKSNIFFTGTTAFISGVAAGVDNLYVKCNDGSLDSNVALLTVVVTPEPLMVADWSFFVVKNLSYGGNLQGYKEGMEVEFLSAPSHGVVKNVKGAFVYTPSNSYVGGDSFSYVLKRDGMTSNTINVSIDVENAPTLPTSSEVAVLTEENTSVSSVVIAQNAATYQNTTSPSNGSLVFDSTTGNFTYTPHNNFKGVDSFKFIALNAQGQSLESLVTILVYAKFSNPFDPGAGQVNTAPILLGGEFSLNEDSSYTGLLAGSDADGDSLSYSVVSFPYHGSLQVVGGSFVYTPSANYYGQDSFIVKANDGVVDSLPATYTMQVLPVDDAPIAQDSTFSMSEDTSLKAVVLASDIDSTQLFYQVIDKPLHGSVFLVDAKRGDFLYVPNKNYNGSDYFTFQVNDGVSFSNISTIHINISNVNDLPVAYSASYSLNEDTSLSIVLGALDIDGDSLTYSIISSPLHGTLSGTYPNITYTPSANYFGSDSFTFLVNDGFGNSNVATISLDVISVNDLPVAQNSSVSTTEDNSVSGVVVATDVEGDPLTYSVVNQPLHGTVVLSPSGSYTYTPNANYHGSDSFTFQANDGMGNSNVATVSINVSSVNDAPVAQNNSFTTLEDTLYAGSVLGTDVDGDTLTYSVVTQPLHGTLTFNANGTFTYLPSLNYNGVDSFTFQANDGSLDSNIATVTINVTPVNDLPVAQNSSGTTLEDTPYVSAVTAIDVDGNSLTYSVVTQPLHGTVVLNATTGAYTYTPNANYFGPDSFTFQVSDGVGNSNVATVNLNITSVNDLPIAHSSSFSTLEDTPISGGLWAEDEDGDTLVFSVVTQPLHGTVVLNSNGYGTYTPHPNYNGPDSFTFQVSDGMGNSNVATLDVTVIPVDDAPVAQDISISTIQEVPVNVTLLGSDVDGDSFTYEIVSYPENGVISGSFPNLTYTPSEEFYGSDSFTYRVNNALSSNVATVNITVVQNKKWFNTDFTKRQRIYFNNIEATENLTEFPVLIALDSSKVNYAQIKSGGADLRFTDKEGNLLNHEIDTWNTSGESLIWVKVHQIRAYSTNDYIWMYYGNSAATSIENKSGVWSNGYAAVWHMSETSGSNLADSVGINNGVADSGLLSYINRDSVGLMGSGEQFNPFLFGAKFSIGNNNSLKLVSGFTIEGIISPNGGGTTILDRGNNEYGLTLNSLKPELSVGSSTLTANSSIPTGSWTYIAASFSNVDDVCNMFLNGILDKTGSCTSYPSGSNTSLIIGSNSLLLGLYSGDMDEIRISSVPRSSSWVRAQYLSMSRNFAAIMTQETYSSTKKTQVLSIAQTADDGEVSNTGVLSNSSSAVGSGQVSSSPYWSFYRFKLNKSIPQGSVISKANINLFGSGSSNWTSGKGLKVYVQLSSNAEVVYGNNYCPGCSTTVNVSSAITWGSPSLSWVVGQYNTSPDLSSIIQEVVNSNSIKADQYIQVWVSRSSTYPSNGLVFTEDKSASSSQNAVLILEWN